MSPEEKTKSFLEIASQFKLGHLETESFHLKTGNLSYEVKADPRAAHKLLQEIDIDALHLLKDKDKDLWKLAKEIQSTLSSGHKVFMCGCGATGRLSLVLETLFRQKFQNNDQIRSFMAGGDYALIKSVESFEDMTEYGERQLMELGFGSKDLLIASTEGGETPFVIGAANKASVVSERLPFFLYCNPDVLLMPIDRSREVIENPKIHKINLAIGPMAISGSTRMQASTVLMLGIGVGLLYQHSGQGEFEDFFKSFLNRLTQVDYGRLASLTSLEADLYKKGKYLNYLTDTYLGISILTDTTERSPTFSLKGFENRNDAEKTRALSYLFLPEFSATEVAWEGLLRRGPRPVEWSELNGKIDLSKIYGFDISQIGLRDRAKSVPTEDFKISYSNGTVKFECLNETAEFNTGDDILFNHLIVKMLLNSHSTLIMGLLDRYEGNVMTWVRPSNNKLIDRGARYVLQILKKKNINPSYADVVLKIFQEIEKVNENEPVVLRVVDRF
jgi:N-acetylmuramic acid 6-phosphate etherase